MHPLVAHALPRAHLGPHLIYEAVAARDDPFTTPREVVSHVEAIAGQDQPGQGITLHRPAAWRCPCQRELALDYREAAEAWAQHAARAVKIKADVLLAHMLVDVRGVQSAAVCACGQEFRAVENPHDGDEAVQLWAEHVQEAAG
jgi:hypothetical protein